MADPALVSYLQLNRFIVDHPQFAWVVNTPELVNLLSQSVQQGVWTPDKWQAELQATNWWKSHSSAQRDWIELQGTDPGEAQKRIGDQTLAIRDSAARLGVGLDGNAQANLATEALMDGWTTEELNSHILFYAKTVAGSTNPAAAGTGAGGTAPGAGGSSATQQIDIGTGRRGYYGPNGEPAGPQQTSPNQKSYVQADGTTVWYTPGDYNYADPNRAANTPGATPTTQGQPGTLGAEDVKLRALAKSMLVPMSDQTISEMSQQIAAGRMSEQTANTYMLEQAKSLYPQAAAYLDGGGTMNQYVDSYRQQAASTLEINPNSIDFTQPKWQKAISQVDPKTNQHTIMSLSDWQQTIKNDPSYGYQHTTGAKNLAFDQTANLLKTMGMTA